jgi:glycosyltransferase involved in cell wall biosynthesis
MDLFHIPSERIVNIGLAASDKFYKIDNLEAALVLNTRQKYGIKSKFILTVSNLDHRKNLINVLRAFVSLPEDITNEFSLIVVCNSEIECVKNNREISELISNHRNAKIEFLYFIPDDELNILYNICHLFIYASLYEGGGLPVIEAMKCGAPVIAGNTSSIPELIGRSDMLFNPAEIESMVQSITTVVKNEDFRVEIGKYGQTRSIYFPGKMLFERQLMLMKIFYTNSNFDNRYPNGLLFQQSHHIPHLN